MRYGHKMTAWNGISNYLSKKKLIGSTDLNIFRKQLGKIIHDFLTNQNITHGKNPRYWDCDKNCYLVQENWELFAKYIKELQINKL